jgi:hypothetical protein
MKTCSQLAQAIAAAAAAAGVQSLLFCGGEMAAVPLLGVVDTTIYVRRTVLNCESPLHV